MIWNHLLVVLTCWTCGEVSCWMNCDFADIRSPVTDLVLSRPPVGRSQPASRQPSAVLLTAEVPDRLRRLRCCSWLSCVSNWWSRVLLLRSATKTPSTTASEQHLLQSTLSSESHTHYQSVDLDRKERLGISRVKPGRIHKTAPL